AAAGGRGGAGALPGAQAAGRGAHAVARARRAAGAGAAGRPLQCRASHDPMSTLAILLPLAPLAADASYDYALSADGQAVSRHGSATAALLPAAGRAGETVAVVPARALSW